MASLANLSDEELIRAAQAGKLDDFNVLYERYFTTVYNRVRYVIPAEDVDDVTQEVFIAVIRSLKNFRHEARFTTWLRTLVNRQVADYYRSRKPRDLSLDGSVDGGDELALDLERYPTLGDYSSGHMDGHLDDQIVMRQALSRLPEHYREIILLRFAEGLQFDEIAKQQQQSLEATKSLFRRAIASLHNEMKDD
jgi:RNA polymerase sigma-70 factor, ECF subfamily